MTTRSRLLADDTRGVLLGLLGVAAFSLTLPATRVAVSALDPFFVGMGRAIVAAGLAAAFLILGKHRRPTRRETGRLLIVGAGAVVGFPILSAWAMREVDASHGGVMLGVLPLFTAVAATLFAEERPSLRFWLLAVAGSTLVIAFSLVRAQGSFQLADLALMGAVIAASIAYAVGAQLAKSIGGLQVISWALVLCAPLLIVPAAFYAPSSFALPLPAWIGFGYVSLISQFLGFLPWYRGLALGGTARVGQTQLLQPFFTIAAASLLIGETVETSTVVFALLVFGVVALGQRSASIKRTQTTPDTTIATI